MLLTLLHVRASGEGPKATDALYREVLGVMQEKVPNTLQSIHLHCFNGDPVTVKLWSNLKAVPGNKLLLESDSPISTTWPDL